MRDITVVLPTRGRRDCLRTSLVSLAELAHDPKRLEMLLGFDDDDVESQDWFQSHVAPRLTELGVRWVIYSFPRMGYIRLNEYVNALAQRAQGQWIMFWGDDAIMEGQDWDQRIREVPDFRVLRMPTHRCHPYAIFPIVPRAWVDLLGHFSAHQLSDSYVSQVAYLLDIMHNIDVAVTHDRADITGNNRDETFANRPMLEGNPQDPRDFNHPQWRQRREQDAAKIAQYLEDRGQDTSWWQRVRQGQQDPWARMISPEQDPNQQVVRI